MAFKLRLLALCWLNTCHHRPSFQHDLHGYTVRPTIGYTVRPTIEYTVRPTTGYTVGPTISFASDISFLCAGQQTLTLDQRKAWLILDILRQVSDSLFDVWYTVPTGGITVKHGMQCPVYCLKRVTTTKGRTLLFDNGYSEWEGFTFQIQWAMGGVYCLTMDTVTNGRVLLFRFNEQWEEVTVWQGLLNIITVWQGIQWPMGGFYCSTRDSLTNGRSLLFDVDAMTDGRGLL